MQHQCRKRYLAWIVFCAMAGIALTTTGCGMMMASSSVDAPDQYAGLLFASCRVPGPIDQEDFSFTVTRVFRFSSAWSGANSLSVTLLYTGGYEKGRLQRHGATEFFDYHLKSLCWKPKPGVFHTFGWGTNQGEHFARAMDTKVAYPQAVLQLTDADRVDEVLLESPHEEVRLAAARRARLGEALNQAALQDASPKVQARAAERMTDPKIIRKIRMTATNRAVWQAVSQKREADVPNDLDMINHAKSSSMRRLGVRTVTDPAMIRTLATTHRDPRVRAKAIEGISDQVLLQQIMRNDTDEIVRYWVLKRITDPLFLLPYALAEANQEKARKNSKYDIPAEAAKRIHYINWKYSKETLGELLNQIATEAREPSVRLMAAKWTKNQTVLLALAVDGNERHAKEAFASLDKEFFHTVAQTSIHPRIRSSATSKLDDLDVLETLALSSEHPEVRAAAASKLQSRQKVLKTIATSDRVGQVYTAAIRGLNDVEFLFSLAMAEQPNYGNTRKWTERRGCSAMYRLRSLGEAEKVKMIAHEAPCDFVRLQAARVTKDQEALTKLAISSTCSYKALRMLKSSEHIERVSKEARYRITRTYAKDMLKRRRKKK